MRCWRGILSCRAACTARCTCNVLLRCSILPMRRRFGEMIAGQFAGEAIDTVASPAIGGLVIGFAVAQALGVRFIWTERGRRDDAAARI